MAKNYPRGSKFMRQVLEQFSVADTIEWFESHGVPLKTESDNRMFPTTDNSQTTIDCLMHEARSQDVHIRLKSPVRSVSPKADGFALNVDGSQEHFDKVIIATGGSPKREGPQWLEDLGHEVVSPVPSLFTFNMPDEGITKLMGVSVEHAEVRVSGTKLRHAGPLLITHWGMSGPAVLKTSAFGARELADLNYRFTCVVNWLGGEKEHAVREQINEAIPDMAKRKVVNRNPFELPGRLWEYLLTKAELNPGRTWSELGKKQLNKLIETLVNDSYQVSGKTTFKEEFVTAGGVALDQVDPKTMQSRVVPGLYFAGEVMDIDGVTGGFNFQAAWGTGFVAGKLG